MRPVRVDPAGMTGPTPGQARGRSWRRTSWGLHVPASAADSPEQRAVEQSARLPPDGAVTGWAALRLAGANFFDGLEVDGRTRIPVLLAVGADTKVRGDGAATVTREPLTAEEVVVRYGVPCTRAIRALFDEMRRVADWREAVVAMDMAAAADLVSILQMRAYAKERSRWRRARQVLHALDYASELSRSPNESRMRLVWVVDARLPAPLVNREVFARRGRLVGVADLFDPVAGLVGEYDGADHRSAGRHSRDVAREEAFRRLGLEYVKVTGPDLPRRELVVDRVLGARDRARFLPPEQRAWELRPRPGRTLDELLEEKAVLRELYESADAG